ncbi:MAG TPA: TetR/AcrR family transcriptional regulator, partial [Acidimicrobiales bacterium]|nr:TetR/AcrR family transcriptional regulator [Acidimicrobiales bacterium]
MATPKTSTTRRYESPVRRQQALETRERIIEAGCKVLRRSGIRDWGELTIRGIAEQAGVNERTVYRYFRNERGLRDAVMNRLEEKAGIELEGMRLDDVAGFAARIFTHVSAYPGRPKPPLDPTLSDASVRQKHALLAALAESTSGWTDA